MTTNSPNTVYGDVQALIEHIKEVLQEYEEHGGIGYDESVYRTALAALTAQPFAYAHTKVLTDLVDKRRCCGTVWLKSDDESSVEPLHAIYTTPPAQPYAYASRNPKRNDHSKLAAEIVDNLVSTDSCDEEVTEKLILWVLNRLNKEFTTPPAQLLRPVELPTGYTSGYSSLGSDERFIRKSELIAALRQQGYEVKND